MGKSDLIQAISHPAMMFFTHTSPCFLSIYTSCLIILCAVYDVSVGKLLLNQLPDNQILDWSKLKQTADNILKCI